MTRTIPELRKIASEAPESPGVYIMKDLTGAVIYVGKAKSLKNRVSSYFSGKKDIKTSHLITKINTVDFIITNNEAEALIHENSLIKQWNPQFNIDLKDGKSYPVIKITGDQFPTVYKTRNINKGDKKASYFGPFANAGLVDLYVDLIKTLYPLRRCRHFKKKETPCLYYHIQECSAPCCGKISEEEYGLWIKKISRLLSGQNAAFRKEVEKEMKVAAADLQFEKAAKLRDLLLAFTMINEGTGLINRNGQKRDFIHYVKDGENYIFTVIETNEGNITQRSLFQTEYPGFEEEAIIEFIIQFYNMEKRLPDLLILPIDEEGLLTEFFQQVRGEKMTVRLTGTKEERSFLNMAQKNSLFELSRRVKKEGNKPALRELQRILNMKRYPKIIEGFDIAQLHGKFTVASLISFKDGAPNRKDYRHFKIRSLNGRVDDYQAISEAMGRRYTRLLNEEMPLPDLIVIDGGKGQVNSAHKILEALELSDKITLIGLAKKNELIFRPGISEPIDLPEGDSALRIIQFVRDETHRFATAYNQKLRHKEGLASSLEKVHGIGKKKSRTLLNTFGSLQGIYEQTTEEIAKTAGVNIEVAETVRAYLALYGKTGEN